MKRDRYQFRNWKVEVVLAVIAAFLVVMACNLPFGQGEPSQPVSVENVHPTKEPIAADLTLSWTNSMNIQSAEGGSVPGVIWRVTNKTKVEFVKGELMYLTGGVLEDFSPTRMEFTTVNQQVNADIVNLMFVKLTDDVGNTSDCVIHLIEGNVAYLACTGFSAPAK